MSIIDSLKRPRGATYRDPPEWLREALGGNRTLSGVHVGERNAVQVSTVFRCIYAIATTIGSLPIFVHQREKRGKKRLSDHPITYLLHDQPNSESTAMTLRETLVAHAVSWGNGYAEIQRNGIGRPVALWLLETSRTSVRRRRSDGAIQYVYKNDDGTESVLSPMDVLHIPGPGFDGMRGYSVLRLARESIGLTMASERFGASFFANGAHHSGVLEMDSTLKDDAAFERLRKSWQDTYSGVENSHKVAILEQGLKFKQISIPPEDAQFLETRRFQVEDLCRWYGVPPHKAGHLERSTNNNIEHQAIEWVVDTIRPWCIRIEQELNRKLFMGSERASLFAEHIIDGLLRGDFKTRMEGYGLAIRDGHMTRNEAREIENRNPLPGLDEPLLPLNMTTANEPAKDPDNQDETKKTTPSQDRARALLSDAARRVAVKEHEHIKAAIQRLKESNDAKAFDSWVQGFIPRHAEYVAQTVRISIEAAADYVQRGFERIGNANDVSAALKTWINDRSNELIHTCEVCDE